MLHRGTGRGTPDGQQAEGLFWRRDLLADMSGIRLSFALARTPDEILHAVSVSQPDTVLLFPDWRWPADTASELCRELHDRRICVVFLDYYAPASSPHFGVLPYVHTYLKRQILRDVDSYQRSFVGGTPFTDFVHSTLGIPCDGWGFSSRPDPRHLSKLRLGWNLGVCKLYWRLCQATKPVSWGWRLRPIELSARIGVAKISATGEWYEAYRLHCIDKVRGLVHQPRMFGVDRVGIGRYFAELMASRSVLSPFGWGEVCFRDYEAVACGALLLKPSMDHLRTEPDIYQPMVTYVPLTWDLSNLEEQLDWIRGHPAEAYDIVCAAQRVLSSYLARAAFTDRLVPVLQQCRATRSSE